MVRIERILKTILDKNVPEGKRKELIEYLSKEKPKILRDFYKRKIDVSTKIGEKNLWHNYYLLKKKKERGNLERNIEEKLGDTIMKIIENSPPRIYLGRINLLNEAKKIYENIIGQYPLTDKGKRPELNQKIEYINSLIKKEKDARKHTKHWSVIVSIVSLISALIFTSFSLTGFSIGGLVEDNFRFIGTGFFICGLVFAFLYFRRKKNFLNLKLIKK